MLLTARQFAALLAVYLLGIVAGVLVSKTSAPMRVPVKLAMPPGHWPVEITAWDEDGVEHAMRFACVGELEALQE